MKVIAPGKLILSGEHAVVHGCPAIAVAINRHVTVTLTEEKISGIQLILSDLAHRADFSLASLKNLRNRLKRKYERFLAGDFSIHEVLKKPFELAQYVLGQYADVSERALVNGMSLDIQSTIPVGCGMGSSAATIICVIYALAYRAQGPLSADSLFQLALEAENLQHGYSSGLDLRLAQLGGGIYVHGQEIAQRAISTMTYHIANTGKPLSLTGECVAAALPHFKSESLKQDFSCVTAAVDRAITSDQQVDLRIAIKENHRLLSVIGVVPNKIKHFIAQIEAVGGAAKICGAGSLRGNQAGMVWLVGEDHQALQHIARDHGFTLCEIKGETSGVHAI